MGTASGRHVFRFPRLRARARSGDGAGTAAGMTGDAEDQRILDVDGYVHVVDGRIVCFERHMFRLSSGGDRKVLSGIAKGMYESDGVCVLVDAGDDSGNYMAEMRDVGSFPESLQDTIRGARRDCGG